MMRTDISLFGVLLTAVLLTGCGGEPAATGPQEAGAEGAAAEMSLADRLAAADVKRGKTLYFQCRACHSLEAGGQNKVGPNLHGVFGRKAGLTPGFAYSDVMANSDVIWTDSAMDAWLERPGNLLPGNRMVFVGVREPQDRADLIAFLRQETGATAE